MPVHTARRLHAGIAACLGFITIAAVAVAVGLLPLPYGCDLLLRLFLCGVSLYFLTRPRGIRDGEKWVLVGLVVLYNPLVPIEPLQAAVERRQHRDDGVVLDTESPDHIEWVVLLRRNGFVT